MKIYVIRHGETGANAEGRLQGWINEPLNELGVKLGRITGAALKGVKFDIAISSPLDRALHTAKIILEESGNVGTQILTDERLKEIHMGSWEGQYLHGERSSLPQDLVAQFFKDPFVLDSFPEGENAKQVCARTGDFLQELVRNSAYETVLLSTHGFAMRALLNPLYAHPENFWQGKVPNNCAVNIIEAANGQCHLVGVERIYYDISLSNDRFAKA